MREEYLRTALQVGDDPVGDGVVLLNPRVVTPEGEWEAWFHAAWIPGAHRYRTFAGLMRAEYASFLDTRARLYVRTPAGYRRKG